MLCEHRPVLVPVAMTRPWIFPAGVTCLSHASLPCATCPSRLSTVMARSIIGISGYSSAASTSSLVSGSPLSVNFVGFHPYFRWRTSARWWPEAGLKSTRLTFVYAAPST